MVAPQVRYHQRRKVPGDLQRKTYACVFLTFAIIARPYPCSLSSEHKINRASMGAV
jgi:hypothetical protein